jgi:hypothetical protein
LVDPGSPTWLAIVLDDDMGSLQRTQHHLASMRLNLVGKAKAHSLMRMEGINPDLLSLEE